MDSKYSQIVEHFKKMSEICQRKSEEPTTVSSDRIVYLTKAVTYIECALYVQDMLLKNQYNVTRIESE